MNCRIDANVSFQILFISIALFSPILGQLSDTFGRRRVKICLNPVQSMQGLEEHLLDIVALS